MVRYRRAVLKVGSSTLPLTTQFKGLIGLLHLRDTYLIETAWGPRYADDELRQARAAARETVFATVPAA